MPNGLYFVAIAIPGQHITVASSSEWMDVMYNVSTLTRVVRDFTYVILRIVLASLIIVLAMAFQPADANARDNTVRGRSTSATASSHGFIFQTRTTRVGAIALPVNNFGALGSSGRAERDECLVRGFQAAPSAEFPRKSGVDHLYSGGLWVGAIKNGDTLVSVVYDGWSGANDFFPLPYPQGIIEERTTRSILQAPRGGECADIGGSLDAVSEHDLTFVTNDTTFFLDDTGTRPYNPVGLSIVQSVYSWKQDVVSQTNILEWQISNAFQDTLYEVYIGLFLDFDVGSINGGIIYDDDVIGTLSSYPSWLGDGFVDSLDVFWATDHDGDPDLAGLGPYDSRSSRSVMGVQILHSPLNQPLASFNWWVSSSTISRDWGPNKVNSPVVFISGNLGTPSGDLAKYQMMANGEFDYDQMESAVDYSSQGWLPPSPVASFDIADGADTRCLISFGPYTLPPDSSFNLTVALIGGKRFHNDPRAIVDTWDPISPDAYMDQLDFSDLATQAMLSRWFYDNPGRDTDGDGYAGEFRMYEGDTVYYTGDGVPDLAGPFAPPAPPDLRIESYDGKIILRWNGIICETVRDRLTLHRDFEGYRVYIANNGALEDMSLLAHRDAVNFIERHWVELDTTWLAKGTPLSTDSLKSLYDSLCLVNHGFVFHPDSFSSAEIEDAFLLTAINPLNPTEEDTTYAYFPAVGINYTPHDMQLNSLDSAGQEVFGEIRKLYPEALPEDTIVREDGTVFHPYYEYEYAIKDLHPAIEVYIGVSTLDHGAPELGIEPRESYLNARRVWPGALSQAPDLGLAKPGVFPNPYYFNEDYVGQGWERANPGWEVEPGILASNRKITFYNLPDICTITIWTLDGDFVARINHPGSDYSRSETSMVSWDVRNSKNREIRTGLYIYSIESEIETHIGKLVILK